VPAYASDVADTDARLGLWLVIVGAGLLPVTLLTVGATPQVARGAVFLAGLGATATVSIWGGVTARRALSAGTTRRARAMATGTVGLVVGVTSTLPGFRSFVGTFL
jgi:hypothetical protein